MTSLEYKYPLLGRYNEIEFFKDLLDEIGLSERPYSGLVIEVFNENINLNWEMKIERIIRINYSG